MYNIFLKLIVVDIKLQITQIKQLKLGKNYFFNFLLSLNFVIYNQLTCQKL